MNEKQRARLQKNKQRIKASGITMYGDFVKILCTKCKKKVEIRVSDKARYTPEIVQTWVCPYCRLGVSNPKLEEGKKMEEVKRIVGEGVVQEQAKAKKTVTTKPKSKPVAEKKETVDDIWFRVLSAAVGKKLPDEMIAQLMIKENPKGKQYTCSDVVSHRSGFNNGRFAIQKGVKPTKRLEKYEPVVA